MQTYNMRQQFSYGQQLENIFLGVNQTFFSTIIKSNGLSIRDNAFFTLLGEYDFAENFAIGTHLNYNIYADDKKLAINNSSIFNSSAYAKYYPARKMSFTPFIGFSRNEQIGIVDKGPIYGAEALLNNYSFNEFNLYSELKFQIEDIAPRKNTISNIKFNIDKTFENSFRNQLLGLYSEQRKDFYFDTDSLTMSEFNISKNIQSRTEEKYSLIDRLRITSLFSNVSLNIEGSLDWRTIDRETRYISLENITSSSFDTKIEEFRINLNSYLQYSTQNINGIFRLNFSEREEKHRAKNLEGSSDIIFEDRDKQEKRKNNTSNQITLSAKGEFNISSKDKIRLSLFHRKLVYDTPSDLNNDDRDELLSMFGLRYTRKLTPFFDLYTILQGSINRTVYIYKERSANNNILRVLKLIAGGDIRLKYLSSKNSAEVVVNYTVYDFEDLNPNLRSFSFRQLALRDSTTIKLFRSTYFKFLGYLKFSEQGDFQWSGFANNPVRYLDERYAEPTFEYRFRNLSFSFGLRYFALFTYLFENDGTKYIQSIYSSTAPLSIIKYSLSNSIDLSIKGWYEFINTESNKNQELVNLFIRVNWNI
ncbi:MAG: hypothetical protein L3J41_12140 [Melioribacteraceae bacterium]|nr:hypothetical protein [Melioribacteraceae bacterium]